MATSSHAPGGAEEARRALAAWVDEAGPAGRVFLQARLLATAPGRYEVRHRRDAHRSLKSLEWVTPDPCFAREIAQATNAGEHRPLPTAPNLRQGWALVDLDERGLWTALDYLYPACAAHWHAGRAGTLRVTHWRETAGRQGGIDSPAELLADAVRDTVRACCTDAVCLLRVAWEIDAVTPLGLPDEGPVDGDALVPCPEACSLFVSLARQVLRIEHSPRAEIPGLGPMAPEELSQVREIVAAAAEGTLGRARENDFADPTNLRRVRYLNCRLQGRGDRGRPASTAGDGE